MEGNRPNEEFLVAVGVLAGRSWGGELDVGVEEGCSWASENAPVVDARDLVSAVAVALPLSTTGVQGAWEGKFG